MRHLSTDEVAHEIRHSFFRVGIIKNVFSCLGIFDGKVNVVTATSHLIFRAGHKGHKEVIQECQFFAHGLKCESLISHGEGVAVMPVNFILALEKLVIQIEHIDAHLH